MIRSLIAALALSTLCIPQVDASTYTHKDLLDQFKDMGGRVYIDSELCSQYRAYGIQQGASVHLCTAPHKGDVAEMQDTIRHELWHVVQMCHGGPITSNPAEAISDAYQKGWEARNYSPEVWHMEAEAHFVAATASPEEIGNALVNACS